MIKIKKGVSLRNVQPQTALAFQIFCDTVYSFDPNALIKLTSVTREKGKKSLHPYGLSFDAVVLWSNPSVDDQSVKNALTARLGDEYDVIFHDAGSGLHWHVEYDPR